MPHYTPILFDNFQNSLATLSQFGTQNRLLPHGQSYLWQPSLISIHAVSDFLIGSACLAISLALYITLRRFKFSFSTAVLSFVIFIGAYGLTHFMEIWNLWNADYWLSGGMKALTAIASVAVAIYFIRLRPKIMKFDETAELVEIKFKNTFEKAAVGMAHVGLNGKWLMVNPRLCEITGYTEEELLQKTSADITHPDDLNKNWEQTQALLSGEIQTYETEQRCIRRDGGLIWIKLSSVLSRNTLGEPRYFISCFTDISAERTTRDQAEIEKAKIRNLFDQAPTPIAIYEGPEHRITLANPEYRRQSGRDDIVGRTYAEAFPFSTEQGIPQLLTEVFHSGKPWNAFEFPIKIDLADGTFSERYLNSTIQPYRNLNGKVEGLINISYDVTEQVHARQRLEESEQRLQIAVKGANMGVWEWDLQTNHLKWDQHMVELFGGPNSKFGGTIEDYMNRIHPDDRDKVWLNLQSAIKDKKEFEIEHRVVWDDGSLHWVTGRGGFVLDETGRPQKVLGVALDSSSRKKALEAIQSSEERFRTLFEQSPFSIEIHSPDGALQKANRAWIKLWNIPEEDVPEVLRTYNVLQDPQLEKRGVMSYIREGFAGRPAKTPPIRYDPNDFGVQGRVRWVEAYISPIKNSDGTLREVMIIHEDISERKAAEEELRHSKELAESANLAKTQFLANMSHEIRTPLGAMLGFADLMLDDEQTNEDQRKYLEIIARNGEQLYRLINDLLDISKVEANRFEVEKSKFDLEKVIRDITSLFTVKAEQKGIEFIVSSEGPLPETVYTDPVRFKQILTNVIGNAIKFTEKGKVEVTLKLRYLDTDETSSFLEIKIQDTGIGIPKDKVEKLFQPFTQADSATTRRFGGTGLGLFLSKKFAQALGGDIELLSCEENQGCTFQIWIPIGQPEKRPRSSFLSQPGKNENEAEHKPAQTENLQGLSVLVVDDLRDNLDLTKTLLSMAGAQVKTALGAKEALDLLNQDEFNVILMDLQMPQMDGYEAVKKLHELGYKKPIVALTAHAMKGERERCLAAGFDGFLNKPIDRLELIDVVRSHSNRALEN